MDKMTAVMDQTKIIVMHAVLLLLLVPTISGFVQMLQKGVSILKKFATVKKTVPMETTKVQPVG